MHFVAEACGASVHWPWPASIPGTAAATVLRELRLAPGSSPHLGHPLVHIPEVGPFSLGARWVERALLCVQPSVRIGKESVVMSRKPVSRYPLPTWPFSGPVPPCSGADTVFLLVSHSGCSVNMCILEARGPQRLY